MSPPLMWKGFHNIVNTKTNTRSTFVEARGSKRRGVNIVLRLGTQYRDNDPHIYLQRPLQSGLNRRAAAHLFRPSLLKQSSLLSAPHRPPLPHLHPPSLSQSTVSTPIDWDLRRNRMVNLSNPDQGQGKGQGKGVFACEPTVFSCSDPIVLCERPINDMG